MWHNLLVCNHASCMFCPCGVGTFYHFTNFLFNCLFFFFQTEQLRLDKVY